MTINKVFGAATVLIMYSVSAGWGEAPYDPDAPARGGGGGIACGLIETTFNDPDWVMATSDRILRASLCVASPPCGPTQWYDRVFNPCYVDNRYWKFPPNSGTAFAYSMAALGIGTFDGLYIRGNVKFQLFSGTGDGTPFGPLMTGPKYVSIDFWRDVNPACNGFEPGTFFVTGGPGALSDYSIKIGGNVQVLEVDAKEKDNEKDHHTEPFSQDYVLRRGATFDVTVKLSKEYGPGCHDIYLEATHTFDGGPTTIDVPAFESAVPADQWGAERIEVKTNGDKTKSVKVRVNIPADAAVGEYTFKAFVREKGTADADSNKAFDKPVVILFNPWATEDDVYMVTAADREEYVIRTYGCLWKRDKDKCGAIRNAGGTVIGYGGAIEWRYAQFEKTTLKVVKSLLSGLNETDRKKPVEVSRRMTAEVDANDPPGVLIDRWEATFPGGKEPWEWTGSDEILKQFDSAGAAVKYGQCWVSGGMLTTVLRCLGIPTRPITNFSSAHDKSSPFDKKIDQYWKRTATGGLKRNKAHPLYEKIWNFHVWCDAWMKRPDRAAGNDGWQAVDATPQELSGGTYQMGPAPHAAIKGNTGGNYDVDFVIGEVDGDLRIYHETAFGSGTYVLDSTDTIEVGQNISTKKVGNVKDRDIITGDYKAAQLSSARGEPTTLPESGIEVEIISSPTTSLGSNLVWTVSLVNPTAISRSVVVVITGSAIVYDGTDLAEIGETDVTVMVGANGGSQTVSLTLSPSVYTAWTGATNTFQGSLSVVVPGTADVLVDMRTTLLEASTPTLALAPSIPVPVGALVSAELRWTNPLASNLTNVSAVYHVGEGLSVDGGSEAVVSFGTVMQGEEIVATKSVVGVEAGQHLLTVTLLADQLSNVVVDGTIDVFEDCNANGIDDPTDIANATSSDCNTNGIPDECETDCDSSGIPDDCDLVADPLLDCNANNIPDECDVTLGTSPDVNGNGRPDECDADCNDNGVLDQFDISGGTSTDCSGNGIPDECETDCNVNGIADVCEADCNANAIVDECDVASGTSPDGNANGIPDECELDPPTVGNDVCSGGPNANLPCSLNDDCPAGFCGMKNRYISITLGNPGQQMVIQITAMTLPPQLNALVGDIWYANTPIVVNENPIPGPTMKAAPLTCGTGDLRNWAAEGVVHLTGAIIVPGATYEVRQCTSVGGLCSNPLIVGTNKHGDVVAPLVTLQPNFGDIAAMVDKFQSKPAAISKSRPKMQPNIPNPVNNINFLDISAVVGAFQGQAYGFTGVSCP